MASIINIVLSIILGKIWGIFGILIATSIARLTTNMWFEPYKLFKLYFKKDVKGYYITQIKNLVLVIGLIVLISFLCHVIVIDNGIIKFIIECLLCIIIPNLTFYIIFRKSNEFKYIIEKVNFRNLFFNKGK